MMVVMPLGLACPRFHAALHPKAASQKRAKDLSLETPRGFRVEPTLSCTDMETPQRNFLTSLEGALKGSLTEPKSLPQTQSYHTHLSVGSYYKPWYGIYRDPIKQKRFW